MLTNASYLDLPAERVTAIEGRTSVWGRHWTATWSMSPVAPRATSEIHVPLDEQLLAAAEIAESAPTRRQFVYTHGGPRESSPFIDHRRGRRYANHNTDSNGDFLRRRNRVDRRETRELMRRALRVVQASA